MKNTDYEKFDVAKVGSRCIRFLICLGSIMISDNTLFKRKVEICYDFWNRLRHYKFINWLW